MPEELSAYRPAFTSGSWSEQDLHYLDAFASNPAGIISVLRNLPPEITGALCSRASRASGSLLEVLLKEYIYPIVRGDDSLLARELEDTVAFLKEHTSIRFTIEGHCDERGSTEYNLALGDNRAGAVRTALIQAGIAADRIRTISYGKERPFCTESNEACWQQNRRGHFVYQK